MRQAKIDAEVHWPRERSPEEEGSRARRNGLLALVAVMVLGVVYARYGGSVTADPSVLTFGDQVVGAPGVPSEVKLTGQGLRDVTVCQASIEGTASGAFKIVENHCLDATLAPGTTCSIFLTFVPTAPGLHLAWLLVAGEASTEPLRIALVGSARKPASPEPPMRAKEATQEPEPAEPPLKPTEPTQELEPEKPPVKPKEITPPKGTKRTDVKPPAPVGVATMKISPSSVEFSPQAIGSSSPARKVTLKSTGSAPLKVAEVRLLGDTGDFRVVSSACEGQMVDPSETCEIQVAFSPGPGRPGDRRAVLVIQVNTPAQWREVSLFGSATTAASELTVTPPALWFPDQQIRSRSAPTVVSVANDSKSPLGPVMVTMDDQTNFAMGTNTCDGTTLPPGARCEFEIMFTPTDSKTLNGTMDVRASGQSQLVFMMGKGVDPGWCCIGQEVVQLDAAACTSRRGGHYATREDAVKACLRQRSS